MIKLLTTLTATLRDIVPESYHEINLKKVVVYPYLTFTVTTTELDRNMEDLTLEIDVFDRGSSQKRLLEIAGKIKEGLKYRRDLTEDHLLVYRFQSDFGIPTLVENLRRRNLTFGIRTAYRNGYDS